MTRLPRITAVSLAVVVFALMLLQVNAFAQEDQATATDPPSRVARLSYLSGDVSFQPNGVDDWVAATLNRPLTTSDRLWTARGARAELQIGNAALRLNDETSFTLANLGDQRVQVQLAQGVLNIRLRHLYENEVVEIDTPNFTLNLLRDGEYAVRVDNDRDTSWVTVRSGSAEVTGGPQAVTVQPGQQAKFSGAEGGSFEVNSAPGRDGFDQWCYARDQREENARSAKYVSRDVIGYEDLDDYGTWRNYDGYGQVWVPVVSAGWAPYRTGHWAWIYPWGWTWVDDAPWGFAPFHYGRWVHCGYGWAWAPGPMVVRPVYAPALVAWVGGGGWGVGLSFGGGYGWIPLGPREPYIPWYWGSRSYFSRVNVRNTRITNVNITNIYNNYYAPRWRDHDGRPDGDRGRGRDHAYGRNEIRTVAHIDYANRKVANGVTFVDRDSFVNGRPVSKSVMRIPNDKLRNAPVIADIDARPDRKSVLGGRDQDPKVRPPQRALDRSFVSRTVAPKPLPFDSQAKNFRAPRPLSPNVRTKTFADGGGKTHVVVTAPREEVAGPGAAKRSAPVPPTANVESRRAVPRPPENAPQRQPRVVVGFDDGLRRTGERNGDSGNANSRNAVPRPPEQAEKPVKVDFGTRTGPSAETMPKRVVPKPPEDRTAPRENGVRERNVPATSEHQAGEDRSVPRTGQQQVNRTQVETPQQHINANRGASVSPREVNRPPQQVVRQPQQERVVRRTEPAVVRPASPPRSMPQPERRVERTAPEVHQSAPQASRSSSPDRASKEAGRSDRGGKRNQ